MPSECSTFPTYPDYIAAVCVEISEKHIPSFLRQTHYKYMVFGGRAADYYSRSRTLSPDWDIILFPDGDEELEVTRALNFATKLIGYAISRLPKNLSVKIEPIIKIRKLESDHNLFSAGIRDPYLDETSYFLADVHIYTPKSTPSEYEYTVRGTDLIVYAPREFIESELTRTSRERYRKYKTSVATALDYTKSHIDDKVQEIERVFDRLESTEKMSTRRQTLVELRSLVDDLELLLKNEVDVRTVAVNDAIKYIRTSARQNALRRQ